MGAWNLGSVGAAVLNLVPDVPTGISGLLPDLANQSMMFAQNYTGQNIGSNSINETFQGPIMNLTAAKVSSLMAMQGVDESVSLGEFSVSAGPSQTSNQTVSDMYNKVAMMELTRIGGATRYGRTY